MERDLNSRSRPLGTRSTNTHSVPWECRQLRSKRKLSLKNSTKIFNILQQPEDFKENVPPQDIPADASSSDGNLTETLKKNLDRTTVSEKMLKRRKQQEGIQPLNKDNLVQLQTEMSELENVLFPCKHFVCGQENKTQLNSLRLWLLFEMEMSHDTITNLRDTCYHDQVYEAVCPQWKIKSCLAQDLPDGFEPFPIMQLLTPEIEINQDPQKIKEVTVEVADLVERSKIPPTFLSGRNRKEIFNETTVGTKAIIKRRSQIPDIEISLEESDIEESDDQEEAVLKKRPKKEQQLCTLEKKLALMGGMATPKLSRR